MYKNSWQTTMINFSHYISIGHTDLQQFFCLYCYKVSSVETIFTVKIDAEVKYLN